MSRLTLGFVLASTLIGRYALAETQAEIAEHENEEGKQLMFAKQYSEASAKFRDAATRTNEGKYYFNLCTSEYQEGKFGEAVTACNIAEKNAPDDALRAKVAKLRERITEDAKKQGVDVSSVGQGGGGGETNVPPADPNNPPPNGAGTVTPVPPNGGTGAVVGGPSMAVGRPPEAALFVGAKPEHTYAWALGGEFYGGGGRIGRADYYGSSAFGVRFHGDYMVKPKSKIGVQAYLGITHFDAGQMQTFDVSQLDVFDLGIAGYKHFCPIGGHLCITPLLGVQLGLLSPAGDSDGEGSEVFNYASFGVRGELALSYAFGTRFENVISAMVGVNGYTKVFASPSDPNAGLPADEIGLDAGGAFAYFGLGYTHRFDTPFGSTPFVTLE